MINREVSVLIALIHNNDVQRNAYIRPQLEKMAVALGGACRAETMEFSFQPRIKSHSIGMAFMRDAMYRRLHREWHHYRLLKPVPLVRDIAGFLKGSFIKWIVERDSTGASWQRNSAIEVTVTEKHIRAWGRFLDSGADFLICFEDDAVFREDSVPRIESLLRLVGQGNLDARIYVDLAGGCKLEQLRIDNLESSHDAGFKFYSKPVTNTACAYFMSRELVIAFHSVLTRKPWLRLIGIDWMMNSLFIKIEHDGIECVCMHATPTIIKHGTTTGEYVSWQAKVPV
jgi:hypothetical protein